MIQVRYCVGRLGLVETAENVGRIADVLVGVPKVCEEKWCIAKLLIGNHEPVEHCPWYYLSLEDVDGFIRKRMETYPQKDHDRLFFPGSLIQYIAAGYSKKER
jgi:hypothetical protein